MSSKFFHDPPASLKDAKDHPTEIYGNAPDISVAPSAQDYLSGRGPVLEQAVAALMKKLSVVRPVTRKTRRLKPDLSFGAAV